MFQETGMVLQCSKSVFSITPMMKMRHIALNVHFFNENQKKDDKKPAEMELLKGWTDLILGVRV